jgi:hypothetical protein
MGLAPFDWPLSKRRAGRGSTTPRALKCSLLALSLASAIVDAYCPPAHSQLIGKLPQTTYSNASEWSAAGDQRGRQTGNAL